jgi:hypothetical protein
MRRQTFASACGIRDKVKASAIPPAISIWRR